LEILMKNNFTGKLKKMKKMKKSGFGKSGRDAE
jgi:hypothetical protein